MKGKLGVGGGAGSQPVEGALAGGRELPLGSTAAPGGGDGLAPDKEKPESKGLSWRNL